MLFRSGPESTPPRTEGPCGLRVVPGARDLLSKAEAGNRDHVMGWKLTSLAGPWRRGGDPGSLAGLLETRPGSAANLLCQQELGPSTRSPCPQIHLQKMARDRVRPGRLGLRLLCSLVPPISGPLGPLGNMLVRREDLGAALPWRSGREGCDRLLRSQLPSVCVRRNGFHNRKRIGPAPRSHS